MDGKMDTLKYIADSPPRECGGFHEYTVDAAKWAIAEIDRLTKAWHAEMQTSAKFQRERDEAREAAKFCFARLPFHAAAAIEVAYERWPWLAQ